MYSTDDFHDLLDYCFDYYNSSEIGIRNNFLGQEAVFTLDLFGLDYYNYIDDGILSITIDDVNKIISLDVDVYFFREFSDDDLYDIDCFTCRYHGIYYKYFINIISTDLLLKNNINTLDLRYTIWDNAVKDSVNIINYINIKDGVYLKNLRIYFNSITNINDVKIFDNMFNCIFNFYSFELTSKLYNNIINNQNIIKNMYPIVLRLDTNENGFDILNYVWENNIKLKFIIIKVNNMNFKDFLDKFKHHLNNLTSLINKHVLSLEHCIMVKISGLTTSELIELRYLEDINNYYKI